jgi:hypothetical protein
VREAAKIGIAYCQKVRFPRKLDLPKPIIAALENKNETELVGFLRKWINNDFYPFIDIKKCVLRNRKLYVWGMA